MRTMRKVLRGETAQYRIYFGAVLRADFYLNHERKTGEMSNVVREAEVLAKQADRNCPLIPRLLVPLR